MEPQDDESRSSVRRIGADALGQLISYSVGAVVAYYVARQVHAGLLYLNRYDFYENDSWGHAFANLFLWLAGLFASSVAAVLLFVAIAFFGGAALSSVWSQRVSKLLSDGDESLVVDQLREDPEMTG